MKDNWGDSIEVATEVGDDVVAVNFRVYGRNADMELSPRKARKFAKKLKRAAREAEGRQ